MGDRKDNHDLLSTSCSHLDVSTDLHTRHRESTPFLVRLHVIIIFLTFLSNQNLTLLWLLILSAVSKISSTLQNCDAELARTGELHTEAIIITDLEQKYKPKRCYIKTTTINKKKLV